jgi:hypothetical protein
MKKLIFVVVLASIILGAVCALVDTKKKGPLPIPPHCAVGLQEWSPVPNISAPGWTKEHTKN